MTLNVGTESAICSDVGAGFIRSRPTTVGSVYTETCRYRGTRPAEAGAYINFQFSTAVTALDLPTMRRRLTRKDVSDIWSLDFLIQIGGRMSVARRTANYSYAECLATSY